MPIEFEDVKTGKVIPLGRAVWNGKKYVYESPPPQKNARRQSRRVIAIQTRLVNVLSRIGHR